MRVLLRWLGRVAPDRARGVSATASDSPGHRVLARSAGDWRPTHRHRKGGLYRFLAVGQAEADRSAVAIYDDADGTIWVRDLAEFSDGRFHDLGAEGEGT